MIEKKPEEASPSIFERRLFVVTCCVVLVFLSYHLLRELAALFQPLLVAALIIYMAFPIHRWMGPKGIPTPVTHVLLLGGVMVFFFAIGHLVENSVASLSRDWDDYEKKLDQLLEKFRDSMPFPIPELEGKRFRDMVRMPTVEQLIDPARQVAGTFAGFITSAFVVILYLVFLAAEVLSFPARAREAFGAERSENVMKIIGSINEAVGGYLAVMTLINAMIGLLTFLTLALFGIPFALFGDC